MLLQRLLLSKRNRVTFRRVTVPSQDSVRTNNDNPENRDVISTRAPAMPLAGTRCRAAAVVNPQKDADASAISTDTCRRNSSPW
jgi:hypothetical protein